MVWIVVTVDPPLSVVMTVLVFVTIMTLGLVGLVTGAVEVDEVRYAEP